MKAQLRKQAMLARANLNKEECFLKSKAIVEKLLPLLEGKETIGMYIPREKEVDVTSLLFLYSAVGVPKVRNNEEMDYFLCMDVNELEEGSFHILEPTSKIWMSPEDFDVLIVPMVAFDENKQRIGYGKGYYDRYLKQSNALKIGVAYEVQKVANFTAGAHDVKMDIIVTEQKIY